jgi:hypothetical protein
VACVVWDNIKRGAAINAFDRYFRKRPQIFTGNSITPRGDMASRSLMVALNVDRPDPENRTFAHADPLDEERYQFRWRHGRRHRAN